MSLQASPAIVATIAELEASCRHHETTAGELRDAIAVLRKTFTVSTLVPNGTRTASSVVSEPSKPARSVQRPSRPPQVRQVKQMAAEDEPDLVEQIETIRRGVVITDDAIVATLAREGRPMRGRELLEAFPEPRPFYDVFQKQLTALSESGRILRTGVRSGTRYQLRPASAAATSRPAPVLPPAPAESPDDLEVVTTPAREPAVTTEQWRAKVAHFLLREVFVDDALHHIGDIVIAVHGHFDSAPYDEVTAVCRQLVRESAITSRGDASYQRVKPLRSKNAIALFDAPLLTALDRILASGASYDVNELSRNLRHQHGEVDRTRLIATLEALAKERRVERIALGSTTRFRRIANMKVTDAKWGTV